MKKIWPWLLLLLLLIIFCVWSKKDSIQVSFDSQVHTVASTAKPEDIHHIDFVISQNDTEYTLNGNFTNTQQQSLFSKTFESKKQKLNIENTSTNETLKDDDAIVLTNKILPLFISTYNNGKIVYQNQKLTISGTANSYDAQHHMQELLNTSTIASQDNSSVAAPKPITYSIEKNNNTIHVEGKFKNTAQISSIKNHLPSNATSNLKIDSILIDKDSLPVVENFLPFFLANYNSGKINYDNEKLIISGNVNSEEEVKKAKALLENTNITIENHTQVDPTVLERAKKAQEEAKAAEVARLAALEAENKAQIQAAQKAKLEEEAKAAEAARLAALKTKRKMELKTKIENLFKVENIEFNVNKSTLTTKGQDTVNKLASILKEYSSVNIEIAGHTDSDGSEKYNQKLSQSRVDMVKTKLIAQQIDASRLTAKGYGETKPLVPNTTRANKAKNRRVEINILGE